MPSDRRRMLGNMTSLFTLQGANYALPLVTLPYLVRVLGPEKFGLIAFAQAFMQYFAVATDYGFNLSATREVAVHRENPQKLAQIISAVMTIKIALAVVGAGVLALVVFLIPSFYVYWPLYAVVYLSVLGATLFPTWLFQGLERMRDITWMNVGARIITTACIFFFVRNASDYVTAAAIQSVPAMMAAIPAWIGMRQSHRVKLNLPKLDTIREQLKSGWHVFLSTAAINVYTSSNTFILGLIVGPVAVGYFSAANKLVQAVQGLLSPVTQTLYPHISMLAARSRDEALTFIRKVLKIIAPVSFLLSGILLAGSAPLIGIVLGAQYGPAISVLEWLAFLPFIIALSNVFGIQTMLTFGMNQLFSRILMASAGLNFLLVFPLAWRFGAGGAAMSMLLTETFVTSTMAWVLHRRGINLYLPLREAI